MGADHGVSCVGCCWLLMAVLAVVGGMGLFLVGVMTVVVYGEKVASRSTIPPRLTALLLAALGIIVLLNPGLLAWVFPGNGGSMP